MSASKPPRSPSRSRVTALRAIGTSSPWCPRWLARARRQARDCQHQSGSALPCRGNPGIPEGEYSIVAAARPESGPATRTSCSDLAGTAEAGLVTGGYRGRRQI
jgi:hypothetical protein